MTSLLQVRTAQVRTPTAVELLPHLRRARDYIDRHYSGSVDLDCLARVAGLSKYHFARSFESAYGETPIRYLTRRRIERAQDLLRSANLTVTEVCMAVGVCQPGLVLVAVHATGRREPHRLSRPVGRSGRSARSRLLPVHARRP